ncbi:NCS1 family nucleobase:cation symporter-1 [Saccharopolyspora spinosa]|uniref:NCS1 family nucleobase:cation symporter-1 n=1 Tax=Saccharopolyspora spinosa TaxID=60894 RepID=A0A2N3Y0Q4_SACSN|nr:NCS1 family nucleobase:cation symporter-1 [Saccharopolyspora spinosa]PKW16473.1 NCS1 family nucleobase:cation symporter-1 [Saccharopolyspora spinosa]
MTDTSQSNITQEDRASSALVNDDLAPATERKWGAFSIFAMWTANAHSIGSYTFAGGLFFLGLSGWQVLIAYAAGYALSLIPLNLVGFAGQRTGVPMSVFARASFGVYGANIPALTRAVVAIFWFGIQTYLASVALSVLILRIAPSLASFAQWQFLGLSGFGWGCFLIVWALQLLVLQHGMETVRKFQVWAGLLVLVIMLVLAVAMIVAARGKIDLTMSFHPLSTGQTVAAFLGAMFLTCGSNTAVTLGFFDFARFSPNRRAIVIGNIFGMPVNAALFALVSVVVTLGAFVVYGDAIVDPVLLAARLDNVPLLVICAFMFTLATIGINVAANFVSPCYDLAGIFPRFINFKRGGIITAVLSLVVTPWNLYSSPAVVNYFIGALGAFLGPLLAVLLVDYYLVRRKHISIDDLYRSDVRGRYFYWRGFNPRALASFIPAAAVSACLALIPYFQPFAPFAWLVGVFLAALLHWAGYQVRSSKTEPSVAQAA